MLQVNRLPYVERYGPQDKAEWDAFVSSSKNGTFLFLRDYMEYHADRFTDHSLMVRDARKTIVALFPANIRGATVISHEGLTYGGFVVGESMTAPQMIEVVGAAFARLAGAGVSRVVYKSIPHIYHRTPAEEDLYALFRHRARLFRRDVLSVIDYRRRIPAQTRRRRSLHKAQHAGLVLRETTDFAGFWRILETNLELRFRVKPVHTLGEIQLLAARFPKAIRLFAAYEGDTIRAGVVLYVSANVCHVQYNATTPEGRQLGALDPVVDHVIDLFSKETAYFDFGISTERDGEILNVGLVDQKEGFGARAVVHDFYEIMLDGTGRE